MLFVGGILQSDGSCLKGLRCTCDNGNCHPGLVCATELSGGGKCLFSGTHCSPGDLHCDCNPDKSCSQGSCTDLTAFGNGFKCALKANKSSRLVVEVGMAIIILIFML